MYFTPDDWGRLEEVYEGWWSGKLRRPLIVARQPYSQIPQLCKGNCGDFTKSPEDVINEMDWNITHTEYYGDSYPYAWWAIFGAGVIASYLGSEAVPDPVTDTVWFRPLKGNPELKEIHLELDPKNVWFNRCKDLYWAGVKKWRGRVIIGINDLGGEMDILASLMGTDRLLYALIDEPEEIHRLCEEVHAIWHKVYWEFLAILSENNCMHADWMGILSKGPYYTQQCDFCYMIGPEMFDEFVLPYLKDTGDKLTHWFYHLDGKGELKHLDKILALRTVGAVQWQPGDGPGYGYQWIDIYRRIRAAGKGMEIVAPAPEFIKIADDIGPEKLYFQTCFESAEARNAFFDRFENSTDIPYRR